MKSLRFKPFTIGAVVFAGLLALVFAGYAAHIFSVSRRLTDWILIGPVAVIGITALAFAAFTDLRKGRLEPDVKVEKPDTASDRTAFFLMLLVVAYALSMPWLGFDVGTAIFIALALIIQGERRIWLTAFVSIVSAVLLVLVFKHLLWVRMPTLIF